MTRLQRLFIAINFSPAAKEQLADLVKLIKNSNGRGRFCQPDQLHLTLAFLGDCSPDQTELVKDIMGQSSFAPFSLTIASLGRFAGRKGDIWWAGLHKNEQLSQLQKKLATLLQKAGFQIDPRPYRPHITLGRAVFTSLAPQTVSSFTQPVQQIDLMRSVRVGNKMVYTCLYSAGPG